MYKELKGYIIFYAVTIIIVSMMVFANIYTYRLNLNLNGMLAELNRVSARLEGIKTRMQETQSKQAQQQQMDNDPANHLKKAMALVDEIRVKTDGNVVVNGSLLADDIPLTITVKTPDFAHFINSIRYLKDMETNNLFVTEIEGKKDGVYTIKGSISK